MNTPTPLYTSFIRFRSAGKIFGIPIITPRNIFRQMIFLFVNFPPMRAFILSVVIPLWKTCTGKKFSYLFVVYPGSENDLTAYCPKILAHWFSFRPALGGIITESINNGGLGLVLVIPNSIEDMTANPHHLAVMVRHVERLCDLLGANSVSYAGQIPSLLNRFSINSEIAASGIKAAIYCIWKTIIAETGNNLAGKTIAIIGVGFVGRRLANFLKGEGCRVLLFDKQRQKYSPLEQLRKTDIAVLLTPRGEMFSEYKKYIRSSTLVVDDTHPEIPVSMRINVRYKAVAVCREGVQFVFAIPGYPSGEIPGCCVASHTIPAAAKRNYKWETQREFNLAADALDFLIPP